MGVERVSNVALDRRFIQLKMAEPYLARVQRLVEVASEVLRRENAPVAVEDAKVFAELPQSFRSRQGVCVCVRERVRESERER